MSKGRYITPDDLGLEQPSARQGLITLGEFRLVAEREAIHSALRRNRSNCTRAAQELGIARMTLYRLMEKYGMKTIDQKVPDGDGTDGCNQMSRLTGSPG
jgi:DNA-binding NtrC family response regulator